MKPYIKLKDQVNKKLAFGDYIISSEQGPVVQKRGFRRIMLPYGALPPIPHKMMTMAVCLLQLSMTIYCYLTQGQQEEGLIAVSPCNRCIVVDLCCDCEACSLDAPGVVTPDTAPDISEPN